MSGKRAPNFDKLDLNLLRVFDAIMREGNVTKAGQQLGRKPPAVSQMLARLRKELGDPLFETSGRNMIPTKRALEIAPCISTALDTVRIGLMKPQSFDPSSTDRDFVIGLPIGVDYVIGPMLVEHMEKVAPNVTLLIISQRANGVRDEMRSGEVDAAIEYDAGENDDMRGAPLYADPFVVIAREGHPRLGIKESVEEADFLELPHVGVSWVRKPRGSFADQRLAKAGVKRICRAFVPSIPTLAAVVERTDLIAMLPERIARFMQRHNRIRIYPCPIEMAPIPVHLVWHRRFDDDPGHRWIRDAIQDAVARIASPPASKRKR